MKENSGLQIFILFCALTVFVGCAPISREWTKKAEPLSLAEVSKNPKAFKGRIVIWGGVIIGMTNEKNGTSLIEVLEKRLDWQEEPERKESSEGRFLVLVDRLLDASLYRPDREVTIAGKITGERTKLVGQTKHRYPLLLSEQIYLWREYRYAYPPRDYPYFPFYPWGYYDPWFYDPWWGDYPF
jgi:outer membrane lipoprotein